MAAGQKALVLATVPGARQVGRGPVELERRWGEVAAGPRPGAAEQEGPQGALMLEGGPQMGGPAGTLVEG